MEPHRHSERRPGRPRIPWHSPTDVATSVPGSRVANAYDRATPSEQHLADLYHTGRLMHSEAMASNPRRGAMGYPPTAGMPPPPLPSFPTPGVASLSPAAVLEVERNRLMDQRRGAISSGPSGMPPSQHPPFPPPGFPPVHPAAVSEAERNRMRSPAPGTQSFGSLGMSPPPPPLLRPQGLSSVNPVAVSRAAERNRLRSPSLPYGPPPPPRPSSEFSFDGAPSQGPANFNNDEHRTRSAVQERVERNRLRNPDPFARGSGSHGMPQFPAPPTSLPSEFPLSNERLSQSTADHNNDTLSATIQEVEDYHRGLAARGTGSRRRHAPLLPAPERTSSLSEPDWTQEAMNRALQPPNRRARRMSETMTGSDTRPRTVPTRDEFHGREFRAEPAAEQRASYLRLSNRKIESFVQALPVHLALDLPADGQDCAVCMEKYYGPHQRESPIRLPCNHVLGKVCLLTWLKSSPSNRNNNCCPVCRAVLLERVPIFPPMDDSPSDTSSEPLEEFFDQYGVGSTDQWTNLGDDNQALRDIQRDRIAIERLEHERIMTARDLEHEDWFRERQEENQRELVRLRQENGEHERVAVERNEHESVMTRRDQEHEVWSRGREEEHQRELVRLRQEHAERMEMLQGMRAERRRRRTGN